MERAVVISQLYYFNPVLDDRPQMIWIDSVADLGFVAW